MYYFVIFNIIYCNFKFSNIFLDDKFNLLVVDFGLVMFIFEVIVLKVILVYLDFKLGKVLEIWDVFSFGVLLMEFISGKKCVG